MVPKRFALPVVIALWLMLGLAWPALAAEEPPTVTAQVVHSLSAYSQGANHPLVLRLTIRPGFHINGLRPPEVDLYPTKLTWEPNPSIVFNPPVFPETKPYKPSFADKPMQVHDGEVIVRLAFKVAPGAAPGPHALKAKLEFQACDDQTCLMPETLEIPVSITVSPAGQPGQPLNSELFRQSGQPKGKL